MWATELFKAKKIHDGKYVIVANRLAADLARADGISLKPVSAQAAALRKIENDRYAEKNKDLKRCTEKLNFRKHSSHITNVTIISRRPTNKKPEKVSITIYRQNLHSITLYIDKLDIYRYYEWLEIREAMQREKSVFKGAVEEEVRGYLSKLNFPNFSQGLEDGSNP